LENRLEKLEHKKRRKKMKRNYGTQVWIKKSVLVRQEFADKAQEKFGVKSLALLADHLQLEFDVLSAKTDEEILISLVGDEQNINFFLSLTKGKAVE